MRKKKVAIQKFLAAILLSAGIISAGSQAFASPETLCRPRLAQGQPTFNNFNMASASNVRSGCTADSGSESVPNSGARAYAVKASGNKMSVFVCGARDEHCGEFHGDHNCIGEAYRVLRNGGAPFWDVLGTTLVGTATTMTVALARDGSNTILTENFDFWRVACTR